MKAIDRLAVIRHKSKINKNWRHKELFRIFRKIDIWIVAYESIQSNQKFLPTVIPNKTLRRIPLQRLVRLQGKVIKENYKFKLREDNESKVSKPIITNDEIVQKVITMILEAIY